MDYRPLALGILTSLISHVCLAQTSAINLVTFEAPPYWVAKESGRESAGIGGETVETVTCAAKQAGMSVQIALAPQKRAIHSLRQNSADGYFAAGPSSALDAIASRSHPVALEKWYFFMLDPRIRPGEARIGVVDGSNEEAWLEANGYGIYMSVTSPAQLAALLERGRIDIALMDERAMKELNTTHKTNTDRLHSLFLRYAPLHLYVGEAFQKTHSGFLPAFNRALPACMNKTLALSSVERNHIEALTKQLLTELTRLLDLQQALKAGPLPTSLEEVLTIDTEWQALAPEAKLPLAVRILGLPTSRTLGTWQRSHQGLVTEVMVINNMGTIAAMSKLTSDFWQGDEPKFLEIAGSGPSGKSRAAMPIYISPIRYDSSTARFQITVSAPIFPGNDEAPNGVIALGLDIGKAMDI